jgi:hypothetical protein
MCLSAINCFKYQGWKQKDRPRYIILQLTKILQVVVMRKVNSSMPYLSEFSSRLTAESLNESQKENATGVYETVLKTYGKTQIERMTGELQEDAKKAASEKNFELKRILRDSYIRCKDQGEDFLLITHLLTKPSI